MYVEAANLEWQGGEKDGRRLVRVVVSDGRRRVGCGLNPAGARILARDLYRRARWCEVGTEIDVRGPIRIV